MDPLVPGPTARGRFVLQSRSKGPKLLPTGTKGGSTVFFKKRKASQVVSHVVCRWGGKKAIHKAIGHKFESWVALHMPFSTGCGNRD